MTITAQFPQISHAGVNGLVVRFGDRLSDPANRAALAFRAAAEAAAWPGVEETVSTLASVYLRFDPVVAAYAALSAQVGRLLDAEDWYAAPLPHGRRLWRVPTVYGGSHGPQLEEAAAEAGLSAEAAVAMLSTSQVRVQTIGFAPGLPYLGPLPEVWDIPRQTGLTARVPAGALLVAIRQFVLFPVPTPTGWRHIAMTALPLFRPDQTPCVLLRAGDEVLFPSVPAADWPDLQADPQGGATCEALA
ncbi:MAG: carboxyltransferase domain-containing protein [Roseivivax sp.]|nr:carboxyltransferase domain-containing protein [Roseivivax sp.]